MSTAKLTKVALKAARCRLRFGPMYDPNPDDAGRSIFLCNAVMEEKRRAFTAELHAHGLPASNTVAVPFENQEHRFDFLSLLIESQCYAA